MSQLTKATLRVEGAARPKPKTLERPLSRKPCPGSRGLWKSWASRDGVAHCPRMERSVVGWCEWWGGAFNDVGTGLLLAPWKAQATHSAGISQGCPRALYHVVCNDSSCRRDVVVQDCCKRAVIKVRAPLALDSASSRRPLPPMQSEPVWNIKRVSPGWA